MKMTSSTITLDLEQLWNSSKNSLPTEWPTLSSEDRGKRTKERRETCFWRRTKRSHRRNGWPSRNTSKRSSERTWNPSKKSNGQPATTKRIPWSRSQLRSSTTLITTSDPLFQINIMDETENYLNSILQKRIGSVVNTSAFTKNGNTVARLPQQ